MYLMGKKKESFNKFKHYKIEVKNQKDKNCKTFQSDRGQEYFLCEFSTFIWIIESYIKG